jgi:hypothetical protein
MGDIGEQEDVLVYMIRKNAENLGYGESVYIDLYNKSVLSGLSIKPSSKIEEKITKTELKDFKINEKQEIKESKLKGYYNDTLEKGNIKISYENNKFKYHFVDSSNRTLKPTTETKEIIDNIKKENKDL